MGNLLTLVALCKGAQTLPLSSSDHKQPWVILLRPQTAVAGPYKAASSCRRRNLTPVMSALQSRGEERSLCRRKSHRRHLPRYHWILQSAELKQLLCPLQEGVSLLTKRFAACCFLPGPSFSAAPAVISPLSDLLVFARVFHHPRWGLSAGCSQGVHCSFPEPLSLELCKLLRTDSTTNK